MAGAKLTDFTEAYVFFTSGAAPTLANAGNPAFDDYVGVGKVCLPANEIVCDPPPELARTTNNIQETPIGRKIGLSKSGSSTFNEVSIPLFLTREGAGFAITAEQSTANKALMDLADGTEFNMCILLQAPTATPANNITRSSAGALTIPASIDEASVKFVRAQKGSATDQFSDGSMNKATIAFTPSEVTNWLDHA